MAENVVKKRKRVSKNKKKNWRKHTHIEDVEEFMDERREEERTGGPVSEKADEVLFKLDTVPAPVAVFKKKRSLPKTLKCHALLEPDPTIAPARIQNNFRNLNKSTKGLCSRLLDLKARGVLTATKKQAKKDRHITNKSKFAKFLSNKRILRAKQDLWANDDPVVDAEKDEKPELEGIDEAKEHYMRTTSRLRKKRPASMFEKPSWLPHVEVPHPGASYNPALADHLELLQEANVIEEKKLKGELRITRAMDDKFPTQEDKPTEASWLKEMSVGMDKTASDHEEEFDPEELDCLSNNPIIRRDGKKTPSQKKKDKRRKLEEQQRLKLKEKKIKDQEFFRIKSIQKELRQQELKVVRKLAHNERVEATRKYRTSKIGKNKFEPAELEIKLTDELVGSLRSLKPEGNVALDRIRSMEKRNMIVTVKKIPMNQRKRLRKTYKYQEKRAWREITL